jgi:hypothetical protein
MSRLERQIIAALLAVTTVGGTACYGYYPPPTANLTGRDIQISLTDSGAVVLAPKIGSGIESVDGKVLADTVSHLLLSVMGTQRRDGIENTWKGESLDVPRSLVAGVMERRFSRARTLLFVAATTIAMVAVKRAFGGAGGANAPGNTQPPPGGQ